MHNPVPTDNFLSELEVVMEQSDDEYAKIMKELKTEIFGNRCKQERLREHLARLEQKEEELERPEAEENSTRLDLEEELCSNDGRQEKLRKQLHGLEKRLRVLEATASAEEFLQDEADEVGHVVLRCNSIILSVM